METMSYLRKYRICEELNNELSFLLCVIEGSKDRFIKGKTTANRAKKSYIKRMERATIVSCRLHRIAGSDDILKENKYLSLHDFTEVISFFEG